LCFWIPFFILDDGGNPKLIIEEFTESTLQHIASTGWTRVSVHNPQYDVQRALANWIELDISSDEDMADTHEVLGLDGTDEDADQVPDADKKGPTPKSTPKTTTNEPYRQGRCWTGPWG
jgi:hypothetical protein